MSIRGLAHSLLVCTGILRMAALLVPGDARAEWLEEWRSELWHVWHICNQNHGPAASHRKDEIIAFALGAFKDAIWLRRNRSYAARRQGFRAGTPSRCILTLAIVAAVSLLIAYCRPGVWKVMRPNSYHDARDLVMISRSGFQSAQYPTIQFSEYEAWRRNSHHLFTGLAFYSSSCSGFPSRSRRPAWLPTTIPTYFSAGVPGASTSTLTLISSAGFCRLMGSKQ
jgi:hypothetical protein